MCEELIELKTIRKKYTGWLQVTSAIQFMLKDQIYTELWVFKPSGTDKKQVEVFIVGSSNNATGQKFPVLCKASEYRIWREQKISKLQKSI